MSTNKRVIKMRLVLLFVLSALPILTACSGVNFAETPVEVSTSLGTNPTCTETTVGSITRMTKIIFLVDTSGSNAIRTRNDGTSECLQGDADFASCALPTDPTKSFRGGAIQNFLNTYSNKTNFQWGLISFHDASATALLNNFGDKQSPFFTNNSSYMQMAINDFYNETDYYATPYQAALELAKKGIQNDRDLNSADQPQYFIVLLTDGFPTDYNALNGQLDMGAIESDITALKNVAPGRVSLSTIYYGHNNANALSLLNWMSQLGNGQFANVNNTSSGIRIDDVIPGRKVCL